MLTPDELQQLGQILDTSWGRSSIITPTMSIKADVVGDDRMRIIFTTLGTFGSDRAMSQQVGLLDNESIKITDTYLKRVKGEFKDVAGRTLKTEVVMSQPGTEIVSLQPHISPRRTAYYRRTTILKVD